MIKSSDVIHVTIEKKTLGGPTHWVEHPEWEGQEVALCYRKIRRPEQRGLPSDARCNYQAGHKTDHLGEGACVHHGGSLTIKKPSNGVGDSVSKTALKRKIDDYIETGDRNTMLDLTYELATLRVLLQETLELIPDIDDKTYNIQAKRAVEMVQATGSLVDKISKVQSRNNITAAQVMYLRVAMADILAKHLPDPDDRERAIKDLMSRIRGGEGDQETRVLAI